jgi:antitoxin (DNA-binding transcriptional repressor) of toxin-antitoxin stability system
MTIHVNHHDVERQFQHLFSQVLQGEEVVITADGEEMARLVPALHTRKNIIKSKPAIRVPGIDKGRFVVPDDFDDPLPADILAAFEGEN